MNQLGDQEAQILAYSQAVKKLEAQLVTFQKQQLSLNEKLTFQANEIYEKDEKLKRYRRIGMKAVKEKEQLQKTLDSWKDSSKNLWRLINSGMSSNSKVGLGYEIQSNNEVLSYEEEMNFSVFNCSKEDSVGKPLYSRFTKTNDFKGLCEGSCGNTSEHSFETESESLSEPNEMSKSRLEVTNEKDVSAPKSKEVEPSCVSHIKTPRQPLKDKEAHKVNRKNWNDMMERELGEGYSFTKKKCFVCGSLSHLIKDCDYYEKKMAREAEVKRVVNTGNGVAKPVWTNANRINHYNKFVPRSVQLNAGRPKFNSVRPNINTDLDRTSTEEDMVVSGIIDVDASGHMTDNGTEFKNRDMLEFCGNKGIKQEYSTARTPQQNGVAERMNRTLIEAARTMLADSLLPTTFWQKQLNQANPHAGASEVTNSAGTPTSIASEEKDEEVELIVVPSAVKIPEEKMNAREHLPQIQERGDLTEPKKRRRIPILTL
ncbi:ribonuclease H-like domain-containing protein [Tanacetum coccineum]